MLQTFFLTKIKQTRKASFSFIAMVVWSFSINAQQQTYTNSIGMEFVLVPSGSFVMGKIDPPYPKPPNNGDKPSNGYTDADFQLAATLAQQDALPGFQVNIEKPFYMGRFEVTQEQWEKVMGRNPSFFQGDKVQTASGSHPVEQVNWKDAQAFIKKLNKLEKGKAVYRLPTEAEWEYAARAGAEQDIVWEEIRKIAQIGNRTTMPVGGKQPNAWGFYDMLGNVWEWVQDFYNEKIFAEATPLKRGKQHVLKGASFVGDVKNATYMTHAAGPGNGWDVGFRLVVELKQ